MNQKMKKIAVSKAVRTEARASGALLKQVHKFAEPAFGETRSATAIAAAAGAG